MIDLVDRDSYQLFNLLDEVLHQTQFFSTVNFVIFLILYNL